MAMASAWSGGGRPRAACAAASSVWPRRSTRIEHLQRGAGARRGLRPRGTSVCLVAAAGAASSCFEHLVDPDPAGEQAVDRGDDRHVDAALAREPGQHRRGEGAFRDRPAVGQQLGGAAGPRRSPLPSEKLRELVEEQVRTRSPRPDRPASVSRRAPQARPKRVISAKPRAISAARAFWPSPLPSTTPQAIASTFLTAPPISAPATSSVR